MKILKNREYNEMRENVAVLAVMLETAINANDKAMTELIPIIDGKIAAGDAFASVDNATWELKWAVDYVKARCAEAGITLELVETPTKM